MAAVGFSRSVRTCILSSALEGDGLADRMAAALNVQAVAVACDSAQAGSSSESQQANGKDLDTSSGRQGGGEQGFYGAFGKSENANAAPVFPYVMLPVSASRHVVHPRRARPRNRPVASGG